MGEVRQSDTGRADSTLPIGRITLRALALPFSKLPTLAKFGIIPLGLALAAHLVGWLLGKTGDGWTLRSGWIVIAHTVIFTPFAVAWTKLAVDGNQSVASRGAFVYGPVEWRYLIANSMILICTFAAVGLPYQLLLSAYLDDDRILVTEASLLTLVAGILIAIGYIRIAFLFPAIATERYQGLGRCWRQTSGQLERLGAIIAVSYVPFFIAGEALKRLRPQYDTWLATTGLAAFDAMLHLFMLAAVSGAPALAYKFLVIGRHRAGNERSAHNFAAD